MGELSPLGIPQMVVILALLGFALWKQGWIRVALALSLIIWGAVASAHDMKIAAPLIGVATVLFFMGIFRLIQNARQEV